MSKSSKDQKQPTLSLAMMVKDEERFLEEALLSARGFVDEMIVVDTGSTDRTVEIAKDCGAQVSFFPWPNDFSLARNETIKRSTKDWIVILDADERFRGSYPHRVRELMKPSSIWPYQAIMLNVINQRLDGSTTHSFFSPRIFPRHPDIGYFGRIHNCFGSLSHGEGKEFDFIQCQGLEIIHLGYDKEVYLEKNKELRNITLLEAAVREEPQVARYRFYLGREYLGLHRYAEAETMLRSVLSIPNADPMCRRETRLSLLQCLKNANYPFETLLTEAISVIEETPNEADAWYLLALIYSQAGYSNEYLEALEQALNFVDQIDVNMQTSRLKGERARAELVVAQHYAAQIDSLSKSKANEWYQKAWSHLNYGDEGWAMMVCHLLKWSLEQQDASLIKSILDQMTPHLNDQNLNQAFLLGLQELAEIDSKRICLKLLRKAQKQNPNLRKDLQFTQALKNLS